MDIKTQTRRSTAFKENILNLNCWVNKNFEMGFVTSKYWGDFEHRKEVLVEIEIKGTKYNLPLSKLIKVLEKSIKKWKNWDYTKNE